MFISCKPLFKSVDGINKTREYADNKEYVSYYSKKLKVDENSIFFFKTQEALSLFFRDLSKSHVAYFYGIKVDDKLYRISPETGKSACLGVINQAVQQESVRENSNYVEFEYTLDNNLLTNHADEHPIISKKVAVFVLSDKLGNTNHNAIKKIIRDMDKETTDFFLISVDRIAE